MTYTLIAMIITVIVLGVALYFLNAKLHIFGSKEEVVSDVSAISTEEPLSYVDSGMTIKVKGHHGTKYSDAVLKYGSIYNLSVSEKEIQHQLCRRRNHGAKRGRRNRRSRRQKADITVVVSLGPSTVTIPDLSGKSYEEAALQLVSLGFSPANISKVENIPIRLNTAR